MGYRGREEYLCREGHHTLRGCWDEQPTTCLCGARVRYTHSIDDTNGEGVYADKEYMYEHYLPGVPKSVACYAPKGKEWRRV